MVLLVDLGNFLHLYVGIMNQNTTESPAEDHAPAPVDDFFFHFVDYAYQRRKIFITVGLVIFGAIFAALGWFEFQTGQTNQRNEQLYQLEAQLRDPASQSAAFDGLDQFQKENPGTSQAHLSKLYRANVLGAKGDFLKAEFELNQMLSQLDPKTGLYVVVQVNLANLLRDQGKSKEALALLDSGSGAVMQDALLIEKAEIHFALKKYEEAKTTLNSLLEAYPNSLYKQRAEQLLKAM